MNDSQAMLPSTWIGRAVMVSYEDADGKGCDTTGKRS
jgi:hypothetical protein